MANLSRGNAGASCRLESGLSMVVEYGDDAVMSSFQIWRDVVLSGGGVAIAAGGRAGSA